ncbi:hypothetical protein AN958_02712 [Leucoagaricus sp. SymC.cos]|nr:hypothetical protein AN958_02712 [Leucoagaricus sp. SymC.cos]
MRAELRFNRHRATSTTRHTPATNVPPSRYDAPARTALLFTLYGAHWISMASSTSTAMPS